MRELRNAIERAILLCDGGLITSDHLPAPMVHPQSAPAGNGSGHSITPPADGLNLEAVECNFLGQALTKSKGNKTRAARLLGLTRAQLYWRLEKYGFN